MTLTASIAASSRVLTLQVRINNVLIVPSSPTDADGVPGIASVRIQNHIGSAPVCSLEVNRTPTWISRGMAVTVDVGYDGFTRRRFTGTVQDRSKGIGKGTVNCVGASSPLYTTSIIPDQTFTNVTTASALATLLTYAGVTNRSILTTRTDVAEFTIGTVTPATLQNMSASQMVNYVMELQGCKVFETGAGVTVINVIDEIPAPTPLKTYTTNANATARILSSDLREDASFVRTRVKVTGATPSGGTTLTSTAQIGGVSPLVKPALPASSYVDAGIFNSLADTQAKCDLMSLFYLSQWHRVPKYLDIDIPGDPEIECAATIGLVIPEQDINGNFFVSGWEDTIDDSGYRTTLSGLRGGDDIGGTLTLAPYALFTMQIEREVFGTGTTDFVVVGLDASAAYDPDGSLTGTYTWTSNKTTLPTMASSTAKTRSVRIDSASLDGTGTDWTITLVVTDNDGATATMTQTVSYPTTSSLVTIPALGLAYNSGFGISPDGGQNWNDITGATCISIGMRPSDGVNFGHAIAGFSNGVIKRTTDGGLTSAPVMTSAAGVAINDVQWDWRNGNVCWAIDENCIVYISLDQGVTWTIYKNFRTVAAGNYSVKAGSYVGDGTNPRAVTGLGFAPKFITIFANGTGEAVCRASGWVNAHEMNGGTTNIITSLDADGFSITANTYVNGVGVTYYYLAIGGPSTLIATGSYVGDGGAGGTISGLSFAPVMAMSNAEQAAAQLVVRTTTMDANESFQLGSSSAFATNEIKTLTADGYTYGAGDSVNAAGENVDWIAFGADAALLIGAYTGDATDDRSIYSGSVDAAFVMADRADASGKNCYMKTTSIAGDNAAELRGTTTAFVANSIQAVSPFQIGSLTQINNTGTIFHYFLFGVAGAGIGTALGNSIGLPFAGGVYIFGGTGAGSPLIAYDPVVGSQAWVTVAFTGDLLTDSVTTLADATMRIKGYAAPGTGTECMILAWASGGGASLVAIYSTTSAAGPSRAFTRATGLTAGLKTGRYIVDDDPERGDGYFYAAFGDQDIWQTSNGIAWTKIGAIMPAGVTPNHAVRVGSLLTGIPSIPSVYMIAAENAGLTLGLYKSGDGMQTVVPIRPAGGAWAAWPASGIGKKISIGAPLASTPAGAAVVYTSQGGRGTTTHARRVARLAGSVWGLKFTEAAASQRMHTRLKRFDGNMFRILANNNASAPYAQAPGQLQRSTDDGLTWASVGPAPTGVGTSDNWGVNDICMGADGTLYLIASTYAGLNNTAGNEPEVHRSTDDGATWSQIFQETTQVSSIWLLFTSITAHPTNAGLVAVVGSTATGGSRSWHSTDATAVSPTFTLHSGSNGTSTAYGRRVVMLATNRLVIMIGNSSVTQLYSDDYGVTTWATSTGDALGNTGRDIVVGMPNVVFVCGAESSTVGQILRSTNGGAAFSEFYSETHADATEMGGMAYDRSTDTLFFCTNSSTANARVMSIANASTIAVAVAVDVTLALDSIFSDASTAGQIAVQGIAV